MRRKGGQAEVANHRIQEILPKAEKESQRDWRSEGKCEMGREYFKKENPMLSKYQTT